MDTVSVPIPVDLYLALAGHYGSRVNAAIEDSLRDFAERVLDEGLPTKPVGVYWESLFLPSGTAIRTKYKGSVRRAEVVGNTLRYEEQEFPSLSRLASATRGNTSVNAWLCVEIKRPMDNEWQKADRLRSN